MSRTEAELAQQLLETNVDVVMMHAAVLECRRAVSIVLVALILITQYLRTRTHAHARAIESRSATRVDASEGSAEGARAS